MKELSYLEGEKTYLRSLVEEDYGLKMAQWVNDKEVTFFLSRGSIPAALLELKNEYTSLNLKKDEVVLAICDKQTDQYLGVVGLHSINSISRHAEFRVLIGEKKFWGKGYGAEACQLIVSYGFHILNLNKIWLGVNADNMKAHNSYVRTGFHVEGTLRQEIYRNGSYHDIVRMSMLKHEYKGILNLWTIKERIISQLGPLS